MRKDVAYISIKLNEKMSEKKMKKFVEENMVDIEIVGVKEDEIKIKWELDKDKGISEIDEFMYHLLDNKELGCYNYYSPF